jgi:hypothetical protein
MKKGLHFLLIISERSQEGEFPNFVFISGWAYITERQPPHSLSPPHSPCNVANVKFPDLALGGKFVARDNCVIPHLVSALIPLEKGCVCGRIMFNHSLLRNKR